MISLTQPFYSLCLAKSLISLSLPGTLLGDGELSNSMFALVSQRLCEAVSSGQKLSDSGVNMLRVLCTVQRSIIQVRMYMACTDMYADMHVTCFVRELASM